MAQKTVKSLRNQTANEALEILNREVSSQTTSSSESLFQGPFGVLNVTTDKAPPNEFTEASPCPARPQKPQPAIPWQSSEITPANEARPDFWTPESSISSPHNHALVSSPNESSTPGIGTLVHFSNNQENGASYPPSLGHILSPVLPSSPFVSPASHVIPERAPQLLRYFKNQIVSLSFPLKGSKKCPWQNIHLPRAEKAYAELLLHQTASNTGLSLFYSLLAASCLHISSRNDTTLDWDKFGKQYKQISRHHLELSIQQEIVSDTRVKYKELLMALLSTVMLEVPSTRNLSMSLAFDANILCIQVTCGNYTDAQNLLVESECLIRKRGLPKVHKSLKVRTLHHVYTYIRIMAESTCGCALLDICPARPSTRLVSNEAAFHSLRSFRVADDSTISDLNASVEKALDIGHNDIHLEVLGVWKDSLFQEMYGLPESLVGLLSQTIRLANEQELLHRDTSLDLDIVMTLNERTKILEYQVLSWKRDMEVPGTQEASSSTLGREHSKARAGYYLSLAVHQGLILFYYRRMHNINALILQDTVLKVLDFIKKSEESAMADEHYRASLLWPAFIAACEALDPNLQRSLLDWITSTGLRTSISAFTAAADVVQQVWKLRQERMDYTISWFNVMDHDRCPIIAV